MTGKRSTVNGTKSNKCFILRVLGHCKKETRTQILLSLQLFSPRMDPICRDVPPNGYVCSVVSNFLVTPPVSSVCGNSPGKNTGLDSHSLLQGIFLPQGSNPYLK